MNGLVQKRRNSSALAMELRLSCTNPSISEELSFSPIKGGGTGGTGGDH